jgi:hypothetical protein
MELHEFAVEQGAWSSLEDATEEQVDNFINARLMSIVSAVGDVAKSVQTSNDPDELAKSMLHILARTLELYGGLVEQGYTQVSLDYLIDKMITGVNN